MPEAPKTKAALAVAPNAPSVFVPMIFLVVGMLALFTAVALLLQHPSVLTTYHYNQHVVALTHLLVLGWVGSVVMGAVYQLVPVALETKLHSERLAVAQFLFHVVGFVGMVWMFWNWNLKNVSHFGSAFAFGAALFIYNIVRTLARAPRWSVIATAIASSLFWLALTLLVGLSIAAGKCAYDYESPLTRSGLLMPLLRGLQAVGAFVARFDQMSAMHAHAHLGVLGCFVMLIVGVSYRLVPMFTISEIQNKRRAAWSVWLLNAGLAGAFLCILLRSAFKPAFALVIAAGLVLYGLEMRAILRARKRQVLDGALRQFLTALGLLLPLALLGALLTWPRLPLTALTGQLENLYGFLAIFGVVSLAIIAMLYKVVPFLVWFGRYSTMVGRHKVPALADLYSAAWQRAGFWLYLAGLGATASGIVLASQPLARAGCALLVLSLGALAANMGRIFSHLFHPRPGPQLVPMPMKGHA
jgi:hypothetical protein